MEKKDLSFICEVKEILKTEAFLNHNGDFIIKQENIVSGITNQVTISRKNIDKVLNEIFSLKKLRKLEG